MLLTTVPSVETKPKVVQVILAWASRSRKRNSISSQAKEVTDPAFFRQTLAEVTINASIIPYQTSSQQLVIKPIHWKSRHQQDKSSTYSIWSRFSKRTSTVDKSRAFWPSMLEVCITQLAVEARHRVIQCWNLQAWRVVRKDQWANRITIKCIVTAAQPQACKQLLAWKHLTKSTRMRSQLDCFITTCESVENPRKVRHKKHYLPSLKMYCDSFNFIQSTLCLT